MPVFMCHLNACVWEIKGGGRKDDDLKVRDISAHLNQWLLFIFLRACGLYQISSPPHLHLLALLTFHP